MFTKQSFWRTFVLLFLFFIGVGWAQAAEPTNEAFQNFVVKKGDYVSKITKANVNNGREWRQQTVKVFRLRRGAYHEISKSKYDLVYPGDIVMISKQRIEQAQSVNRTPNSPTPSSPSVPEVAQSNTNSSVPAILNSNTNVTSNQSVNSNSSQTNSNSNTGTNSLSAPEYNQLLEDRNYYRNATFIFLAITLLFIILFGWYIGRPYVAQRRQKVITERRALKLQPQLEKLAKLLNERAIQVLRTDPEFEDFETEKTFRANVQDGRLKISATGYDQSEIHDFLDRTFFGFGVKATCTYLQSGHGIELSYYGIWKIENEDSWIVPEQDLKEITERRSLMQRYAVDLAAELVSTYPPESMLVNYSIDPINNLASITFRPIAAHSDYFGAKDTPNEYSGDIRNVMEGLNEKWASKGYFSFVDYRKDAGTLVSTVTVRYHHQEEEPSEHH